MCGSLMKYYTIHKFLFFSFSLFCYDIFELNKRNKNLLLKHINFQWILHKHKKLVRDHNDNEIKQKSFSLCPFKVINAILNVLIVIKKYIYQCIHNLKIIIHFNNQLLAINSPNTDRLRSFHLFLRKIKKRKKNIFSAVYCFVYDVWLAGSIHIWMAVWIYRCATNTHHKTLRDNFIFITLPITLK